ncbi:MAG: serine/threonine protein kinase [Deltaproteobacteria bacterium]|nr:serine/threonine protein kinase [Deltaproteobacteria bacterium]
MRVCMRCRSLYHPGTKFCGIDGQELVDFREDPLIGQRVDRYEVVALLGRGASASVYKVLHTELQSDLALKVLHGHLGADAMYVQRFRREAQVVSKIRSPRVVSVVDFGTSEKGLTYLVMEFCTGTTLDRLIARDKMFAPARAARLTSQVAAGLAVAHRMGFVHRDVKPGNIAVETHDGKEQAKVLDFGIVRLPELESSDRLTKQGTVMGTPPYMSPEQADGRDVTDKADLYSLGVVLYEMLAGKKPFVGTAGELFYQHHHHPPPPLPIQGPIADLAYALLAKEPRDRPGSAAAVAEQAKKIELELRGEDASLDPAEAEQLAATSMSAVPTPTPTPTAMAMPQNPAAPAQETQASLFLSSESLPQTKRPPFAFLISVVAAGIIGLIAAILFWMPPGKTDVIELVEKTPSLSALEGDLAQTLERRGFSEDDLRSLPGAGEAYARWQAGRAREDGAAREALISLLAIARTAPLPEDLLIRRLDALDGRVATLGAQVKGDEFEQIKTAYLDLYRRVHGAETDPAREAAARAIRAFEQRISALAVAAPPD